MSRDYFDGCHNEPLGLNLEPLAPIAGPLTATPDRTLADAVHAAEQRRIVDAGQLALPSELMPVPIDRLFA